MQALLPSCRKWVLTFQLETTLVSLSLSLSHIHTHTHTRVHAATWHVSSLLMLLFHLSSNRIYICSNRLSVHVAGTPWIPVTINSSRCWSFFLVWSYMSNYAGAKSGWDSIAIQSSIWRRCREWCNISSAFQCSPELWP